MSNLKIIGEIGINHNGSLDTALRLIDMAKVAGCDYVKFQKRDVELAVPQHMRDVSKETPWGVMTYLEYKWRMEFDRYEYDIIDNHCRDIGMPWFASVWDIPSIRFMESYDPPAWKIPSACLTDCALLAEADGLGQVIISTGMSTPEQIQHAVGHLRGDSIIMHANSTYPCPPEDLNLKCILWLKEYFPLFGIGYSGHEVGLAPTLAAVALGATWIERHITLDRTMWGTDQAASVEKGGLTKLVKDIRLIERSLGDGIKRVTEGELGPMKKMRRERVCNVSSPSESKAMIQ
jgi:N-acetylneuraminate synthase